MNQGFLEIKTTIGSDLWSYHRPWVLRFALLCSPVSNHRLTFVGPTESDNSQLSSPEK